MLEILLELILDVRIEFRKHLGFMRVLIIRLAY